ncbi:MAG: DUF1097 domain-containing protein [Desulfobacteraceae bacterium]|nr:DUF1097 domain-containing protein [Desulfobacteraceae bacterium]
MNLKDNFTETVLLAISVCILVTIWGTFHAKIGITLAWPAFVSAALFFAMGHHSKDAFKVITGHVAGIGWGILFFNLIAALAARDLNALLIPVITLSVLSTSAVILTHLGLDILSHLPSLFSGWAVTVGTLSGVSLADEKFNIIALDTLASIILGIVFLGMGIPFLHQVFKSQFGIKADQKNEAPQKPKKAKPGKSIKLKGDLKRNETPQKDESLGVKTSKYIIPFKRKQDAGEPETLPTEELSDIKNEILKLSKYLPSAKNSRATGASDVAINIVGICGSPHKKGSTIVYLKKILEAAESMGNVTTQLITIAGKDIKPCMGCKTDKCFGECKIKDDMRDIYPALRNADGIVIGSPSYFGTFSGQLKILLDRLRVLRHTNFQLANKIIAPLAVAGRRHGGQEITNLDIIQAMMRHNTIIVNDGTAVCQLGATGWSHTFDDPKSKVDDDAYGLQTCEGVGLKMVEIARSIKTSVSISRTISITPKSGSVNQTQHSPKQGFSTQNECKLILQEYHHAPNDNYFKLFPDNGCRCPGLSVLLSLECQCSRLHGSQALPIW